MKNVLLLIVGSGFLAAGLQTNAQELLATTNQGELVEIDLAAGTATLIGDAGTFNGKELGWTGLTFDAAGDLFAVSRFRSEPISVCFVPFSNGACAHLYRLDPNTGAVIQHVGDVQAAFVSDIDFASGGTLYGNHFDSQGTLITVNPATAIANPVGQFGSHFGNRISNGALSVHPLTGEIWAIGNNFGRNKLIFKVDPSTGAAMPPIVQLGLLGNLLTFGFDALEILPNDRFIATRGVGSNEVYEINPFPDAISGLAEITLIPLVLDVGITGSLNGLESLPVAGVHKKIVSGPDFPNRFPPFVAPDSITFETLNTACGPPATFDFELNGTVLGSTPSDPVGGCICGAPTDTFAVTDSVLIASAWNALGANALRFVKSGGINALAWTRAKLEFGAVTETVCVFDAGWSNCIQPNLCDAGFTADDVDATASVFSSPDGRIDAVVEIGQFVPTMYDFKIVHNNPDQVPVLIEDTVPAEWDAVLMNDDGGNATAASANKKNNGESATKIDWTPEPSGGSITVWAETRGPKKNGKFAPTSCGALRLNDGAKVFDLATGDPLLDDSGNPLESNKLCLVAVSDVDGNGVIVRDGSGDEDGDGLSDFTEACEVGTDPCVADTDGDGIPDGADTCPLDAAVIDVDVDGCED